jgi:hypothetical protein
MGGKVFARSSSGAELFSDERDIAVNWQIRLEVYDWLQENKIEAEYQGAEHGRLFGVDLWRVKNEQQRMLFLLKWGNADCS